MDNSTVPPLNAVRAFAAVGRHLSLKNAAAELHVTPGAVSQQIQRLEALLGRALFERTARGLVLTPAGGEYWRVISAALAQIGEATSRIRPDRQRRVLTLSTTPLFAMKWLLPRLHRFTHHHPEIDVRIAATLELADFRSDGVDLAVRHGDGGYPGLRSDLLFRVALFPVVSPALLARGRALERPEDLARHTLLHDVSCNDWLAWLKAHHVRGVDGSKGLVLSDGPLTIEAARNGLGVALGRSQLVARELAQGLLARPFDLETPAEFAYYLVMPHGRAKDPTLGAFRDFILNEAAAGPGEIG